ncbi:NADH-quinone oxidoreductase subunit C [Candidatus Hepatincolaceae symbiont of Richtersius coronifer]
MTSYYSISAKKLDHLQEISAFISNKFKEKVIDNEIKLGELVLLINKDSIVEIFDFLKSNAKLLFNQLIDITAVDYPSNQERFEVVYHLLSLPNNLRIRIKVRVKEYEILESLSDNYANSDWLEREVWDMFGLYFKGHKDLRRILTDFGFEGHPLRKDFPLTGFLEVTYDEESQRVIYKPLELMQAHRDFNYRNPWMRDIEADTFAQVKKKC